MQNIILFSPKGPNRLWSQESFLFNGHWCSSPKAKRPVREVNHLPPPIAKVKNDRRYTCAPFICLHGMEGKALPFFAFLKGYSWRDRETTRNIIQYSVVSQTEFERGTFQYKSKVSSLEPTCFIIINLEIHNLYFVILYEEPF
jgi:hypothetical protein